MEEIKDTKAKVISKAVCGGIMLLSLTAFLLCGWFLGIWHPAWVIVVIGGSLCGIVGIITNACSKKKDEKTSKSKIINETICGIVVLVCVNIYLFLGLALGLWHPYWIIIPIAGLVCGLISIVPNTYERLQKIKESEAQEEKSEPKKTKKSEQNKEK